jgi:hypothetical protein
MTLQIFSLTNRTKAKEANFSSLNREISTGVRKGEKDTAPDITIKSTLKTR